MVRGSVVGRGHRRSHGQGRRDGTSKDMVIGGGRGGHQEEIAGRRTPSGEGVTYYPYRVTGGPPRPPNSIKTQNILCWILMATSLSSFNESDIKMMSATTGHVVCGMGISANQYTPWARSLHRSIYSGRSKVLL
jgi:hypothetical protein